MLFIKTITDMEKQIVVDAETRRKLERLFNVTKQMVSYSLHFKRDTLLARKIRRAALAGGGELVGAWDPEWETEHVESDGTMVQTYGPRVKVVLKKDTGDVESQHKAMSILTYEALQREVETMAKAL